MLSCLRIQQLAIIEESEIEFGLGLNIVSGETGAGKSIMIHALQLVLGGRARAEMVRNGAEQAIVEALFELPSDSPLLEHPSIDGDQQLVIRRIVSKSGRSRATVNGCLTNVAQLKRLAAGLVDISSQHEHHSLTQPAAHLAYLDAFGGLTDRTAAVGAAVAQAQEAYKALLDWEERLRRQGEREDMLRYQVGEIAAVEPIAGEEEGLEQDFNRLRHGEELSRVTRTAEAELYSGERSVAATLSRICGDLTRLVSKDPTLEPYIEQLESARAEIDDVGMELGHYGRGIEWDPHRMNDVDERLRSLRRLRRKYGGTLEMVIERYHAIQEELAHFDDAEGHRGQLEERQRSTVAVAAQLAHALSAERRREAQELGRVISSELQTLGMGGAEVHVEVAPLSSERGQLAVDGVRLTASGFDHVELLIAPNPGEEPKPLARIASGGELSRALLAIKKTLAGLGPGGLYVFDEVDTGVGGAIAEVIGRKLDALAAHRQVVCITHLPQIAAFASRHLLVSKNTDGGRTRSTVRQLSDEERREEIARMLGGTQITETTRQAADEMISVAGDEALLG